MVNKSVVRAVQKVLEKAPPGMEPTVRTLKKKGNIDNPFAVAWAIKNKMKKKKKEETTACNTNAQLLRKESIRESGRIEATFTEADSNGQVVEGARVKVVLITEGLGNRKNMNYYGPEAIQSGLLFEGRPCFINHPSQSEDQDIPERKVESKCGYFKNVQVENLGGVSTLTGELHFDLSETGKMGFEKALTSLHYKEEFPGIDGEYVGLSVNADGEVEKRMVDWQGETLEVNYVTRFTDVASCDIVTTPARGGKFLALVESVAGALNKEATTMKKGFEKSLENVRTLLKEATKEKDAETIKKKMVEAHKAFEAFLKEAAESEDEAKGKGKEEESEDEANPVKAGYEADMVCPHCGKPISTPKGEDEGMEAASKDMGDKESAGKDLGDKESESEDHKPGHDDDDDVMESRRLAIKSLLVEAGLEKRLDVKDFEGKTLKEAKAEIEKISKIVEADRKEVFSRTGFVPVGFREKVSESNSGVDADAELASILKN